MATPTSLPATFVAGNVLTASQMNGLRGAFRILQSLFNFVNTGVTSASATYVSTGLTQAVTPQSTSSKIRITANVSVYNDTNGGEVGLRIIRTIGATTTTVVTSSQVRTGDSQVGYCLVIWEDTPSTTSATTYTIEIARTNGTGTIYAQVNSAASQIVIEEISA